MKRISLAFLTLFSCAAVQAASTEVQMNLVSPAGIGHSLGTVKITETDKGLVFAPDLRTLPPGEHGFHVHTNGSCEPAMKNGKPSAAEAAGGHFDPEKTGKHMGPMGVGHMGDLPVLVVDNDGSATEPVTAPRLKTLGEIKGRALMVHIDGDNMSDQPKPLGGGGARYACGVIQ